MGEIYPQGSGEGDMKNPEKFEPKCVEHKTKNLGTKGGIESKIKAEMCDMVVCINEGEQFSQMGGRSENAGGSDPPECKLFGQYGMG